MRSQRRRASCRQIPRLHQSALAAIIARPCTLAEIAQGISADITSSAAGKFFVQPEMASPFGAWFLPANQWWRLRR
jgi:hypothetical protein